MESLFYKTEEQRCSSHNGQNVHQLVNGFLKTVVHPNNELLGNKKEWTTDTHTNMNQPQKHYANWKMPDTVIYSLTPLYVTFWKGKTIRTNNRSVIARAWGNEEEDCKVSQRTFIGNGKVLYLYCDGGYMTTHLSKFIKLYT